MDKQSIDKIIDNPELLMQLDTAELDKISGQFPYFSAAQILLARAYQQRGDYRYTDQLHQAAVYANDRRLLYELVKTPAPLPAVEMHPQAAVVVEPAAPEHAAEQQPIEETVIHSPLAELILDDEEKEEYKIEALVIEEPSAVASTFQEPVVEASHPETISEEVATLHETVAEEEMPIPAMDILEQQILVEALHRSIEEEVTPEHEESATTSAQSAETEDAEETNPNSYASWIMRRSKRLHFGEESKAPAEQTGLPTGIGDWIREPSLDRNEDPEEISGDVSANLSHGVQRIRTTDTKSHQKDLIDRFIQLEPNISRGKISEYAAGNIAKDSLEEDFSMVTETIAQLFARQGKFDKARKAYRKLIELYPEKSVYFAAQLKNLDKLKK